MRYVCLRETAVYIIAAGMLIFAPPSAESGVVLAGGNVVFTNKSNVATLNLAIAYYQKGSSLLAEGPYWCTIGWFVIPPQGTVTVATGDSNVFYYYAKEAEGRYVYSSTSPLLWVRPSTKFDINWADSSWRVEPGYVRVGFVKADARWGRIEL